MTLWANPQRGVLVNLQEKYIVFEHRKYRKARLDLQRRIADLDKQQEAGLVKLKDKTPDQISLYGLAIANYQGQRKHLEMELEVLEAGYLLKKAARYGLEATPPNLLYDPKMSGVALRPYFVDGNKAKMRRMIADARKAYWKDWIAIISPLATVIISLLALLVSALAIYLQLTKRIP